MFSAGYRISGLARGTILKKRPSTFLLLALLLGIAAQVSPSSESITILRVDGGEFLPLDELIHRSGIEHSFDMISQKGKLYRKNHYAVYGVGLSVTLIDGSLYKSSAAVRRQNGRVLIPFETGERVAMSLNPELRLTRRGNALIVDRAAGEEKIQDQKPEKSVPAPETGSASSS